MSNIQFTEQNNKKRQVLFTFLNQEDVDSSYHIKPFFQADHLPSSMVDWGPGWQEQGQ